MDIETLSLAGLIAYGLVNVISWKFPNLDKGIKFGILFLVALGALFVPADLGSVIADKAKEAIAIALLMTGAGKIASKAGGN